MEEQTSSPAAHQRVSLAEFSIAAVAGLGLALTLLFLFVMPLAGKMVATRDFVSFWATGQQLVHRGNPYDLDAIAAREHVAGLNPRTVLIMRNPPWALVLVLPLGLMELHLASTIWSLFLIAALLLSVRWLRQLHGSPPNSIHWLGTGFPPALICLTMGQTTLFVLFGLVLFLRFHRSHPFRAGAALWFCTLKPHLFLPFAAALLCWIVFSRAWRLMAGAIAALALTSALSWLTDPAAWPSYLRLMRSPAVENDFIPCLSYMLRHWLRPDAVWLQYLPAAIACLWAILYYWRRRAAWDWTTHSSPLLLISLLAAPYTWFYDQCLAIPALLHAGYALRYRWMLTLLASVMLLIDVAMTRFLILSTFYLWTMPFWLAWYLLAQASAQQTRPPLEMAAS